MEIKPELLNNLDVLLNQFDSKPYSEIDAMIGGHREKYTYRLIDDSILIEMNTSKNIPDLCGLKVCNLEVRNQFKRSHGVCLVIW